MGRKLPNDLGNTCCDRCFMVWKLGTHGVVGYWKEGAKKVWYAVPEGTMPVFAESRE